MFCTDLAIDLGTNSTRVYVPGRGIVLDEPSVVAIDADTGHVKAIGRLAQDLLASSGREFSAVTPIEEGVISDLGIAEQMLRYFILMAHRGRILFRPRIAIGVRSLITEVEKRAFVDSAYFAMPSQVHLVEQPVMAAVGAGIPVAESRGTMIVDIGAGTTDVAVISCMGIVHGCSLRRAGNHMDQAIMDYLRCKYHLMAGQELAEQIKIKIGSAYPMRKSLLMEITARNVVENRFVTITLDDYEIREVLKDCVSAIVNTIKNALECTPPELLADISDRGIVLTGGGSLLANLDAHIREQTGLPVLMADHPLYNAVLGTGKVLSNRKTLDKISAMFEAERHEVLAA